MLLKFWSIRFLTFSHVEQLLYLIKIIIGCSTFHVYSYILAPVILILSTLITVYRLHLGQKRGKFLSSVSSRIIILVLLLRIGHNSHSFVLTAPPFYVLSAEYVSNQEGALNNGSANWILFISRKASHQIHILNLKYYKKNVY